MALMFIRVPKFFRKRMVITSHFDMLTEKAFTLKLVILSIVT